MYNCFTENTSHKLVVLRVMHSLTVMQIHIHCVMESYTLARNYVNKITRFKAQENKQETDIKTVQAFLEIHSEIHFQDITLNTAYDCYFLRSQQIHMHHKVNNKRVNHENTYATLPLSNQVATKISLRDIVRLLPSLGKYFIIKLQIII